MGLGVGLGLGLGLGALVRPELLELHRVEEDAEEQDEVQDEERAELDVVRRERLVRPEEVLAVQAEEDRDIYIRDI